MKVLSLLRHAKSEWDDPSLTDFQRPLNGRGREAARAMGREMQRLGLAFDCIIASPAARVTETIDGLEEGYGALTPTYDERVYLASIDTLLEIVRDADDRCETLLIVGHNPGILASELAQVLHLHRATLSGIIRRLRGSGYLDGTVNQTDGRRVGLTLTAPGRAINRQRAGTFEEAVRRLLASTPTRDRLATERVLVRLGAELRAIAEAS